MSLKPLSSARTVIMQFYDLVVILLGIVLIEALLPVNVSFALIRPQFWMLVPLVILIFQGMGVYRVLYERKILRWCRQVVVAWCMVLGAFFAMLYLTKTADIFPRSVVLVWMMAVPVLLVAARLLLYYIIRRRWRHGIGGQQVLLVGDHAACRRFAAHLDRYRSLGLKVVGICSDDGAKLREEVRVAQQYPWLGPLADVAALIEEHQPTRVTLVTSLGSASQARQLQNLQEILKRFPITFDFAPEVTLSATGPLRASDCGGRPLFTVTGPPLTPAALCFKWVEDKVVALCAIIFFAPFLLLISLLVKLSSPGPIFFVQTRHGIFGRPIRVIKFRTMRQPTDRATAVAAEKGRECTSSGRFLQASGGDSRITWIGKLLRKTSFDELPQFFNVLRGDMSVVGPRPHPVGLNHQYAEEVDQLMHRHLMKPGITGLAQISGARGETSTVAAMRRRVELDLRYIRTWSPWLDIKIILLTPFKGFINYEP